MPILKKCDECGSYFEARNNKARFCKGPHKQICKVCGKEFMYSCTPLDKPNTCSKECRKIYKQICLQEKYGVSYVSQIPEVRDRIKISNSSEKSLERRRKTCQERYGVDNTNQLESVRKKISEANSSPEVKEKRRQSFQKHYGYDHCFASPEFRKLHNINNMPKFQSTKDAVIRSLFEKYGVTNIANIPGVSARAQITRETTCIQKYGENCIFKTKGFLEHIQEEYHVDNVMKDPSVLSKAMRNKQKKSNLEIRLQNFLRAYEIDYIDEYVVKKGDVVHSFDVFLPKYKILIDCDGEYWHSYLSDPDGCQVRDDGDEVRLYLVPNGMIFYLINEQDFERGLRGLQKMIFEIDNDLMNYDSDIFHWCREVGFPYPNYDETRLDYEWNRFKQFDPSQYNENRTFGISIVNQFHKSIYDAHVEGCLSPKQAWEDDTELKKVIANRLIYKNCVDPSKVLKGFSISKIATRVSVFNPTLAKYICSKYLNDFQSVVDPFSGFSGRLLGCAACGKFYSGRDISERHVQESNKIISRFQITNCEVINKDVLKSNREQFDCLFTCPPYGTKEIYDQETVFKSCEDWITECLTRFNCSRYVFVVDNPGKYSENVVEELKSKSHFRRCSEYIVCIDRQLP